MFAIPMPSDLPNEPTETEKKVAAADAAQMTATTAQNVADEYKKAANEAIAADADPLADTSKINLREQAAQATEDAIHMLRKLNASPK